MYFCFTFSRSAQCATKQLASFAGSQGKESFAGSQLENLENMTETIYKFDGDAALKEFRPGTRWMEATVSTVSGSDREVVEWHPVRVGKVWISGDKGAQKLIHISVLRGDGTEEVFHRKISDDQYRNFIKNKANGRRINFVLRTEKNHLKVAKKLASKNINIRVTPELYEELTHGAKLKGASLSNYCRDLLKGKTVHAALTEEEQQSIKQLSQIRDDVQNYFNLLRGWLRGVSQEERLVRLIEGHDYTWYRRYINQALKYIDGIIQKSYDNKDI